MKNKDAVIIIIPAKDEEKSIASVIEQIKTSCNLDVLLVDDGSKDKTADIAESMDCRVIRLVVNLGAWKATQAGIRYALKLGYRKAVTMDADGQHDPSFIEDMLLASKRGKDVVIGSCTSRGTKERALAWRFFRFISGLKVQDLTSGFRVYNRSAMIAVSGRSATLLRYQDIGVLFLIKHCHLNMIEIPVNMRARDDGISRIFNSWLSVCQYCLYSLLLSVAKSYSFINSGYKKKLLEEGRSD